MHWPGMVEIGTRLERIRRTSVTLAQVLFIQEHSVAIAGPVVALIDTTTRRSTLVPEETAKALRTIGPPNCERVPIAVTSFAVLRP